MYDQLFYKNQYQKQCQSEVIESVKAENGFWLRLSDTIFYPEGGGQPDDRGSIDNIPVLKVENKDNYVWHLLPKLPNKQSVFCQLDWDRRFDHMQQHSGQHILSGVADKIFGARTIGFHLSSEYTTIDLSLSNLDNNQLLLLEKEVNNFIFQNIAIKAYFADSKLLKEIPLRKDPKVSENIRVVEINNFDYSPCCGTHLNNTGEVGLLKIIKTERIRRNVRIHFVCGKRALNNFISKTNKIHQLVEITSASEDNLVTSVENILETNRMLNKSINELKRINLNFQAKELLHSAEIRQNIKIVKHISEDFSANDLRLLGALITDKCKCISLLASTKDNTARFAVHTSGVNNINIGAIFKEIISEHGGRGGGNKLTAQGGCPSIDKTELIIKDLYEAIATSL